MLKQLHQFSLLKCIGQLWLVVYSSAKIAIHWTTDKLVSLEYGKYKHKAVLGGTCFVFMIHLCCFFLIYGNLIINITNNFVRR